MNVKHKIVIWGADNYNTLGLLRSLGKYDFDITLLVNGSKGCTATASKYCQKYVLTKNSKEGVEFLIKNFSEVENPDMRSILIPGGDIYSIAIAKNFADLNSRFHLMTTSDPKTLLRVTDKNEMARVAVEAGLNVPPYQFFKVGCSDINLSFPIILKHCETHGRTEFKTKVIKSAKALKKFEKILNPNNTYIMQQLIEHEYGIEIYGCRLNSGQVILAGLHTFERWSNDGGSSYGHLCPEIPKCVDVKCIERFLEIINYHGLFSAEFGYMNGVAYFYEVNMRNDGYCHFSYQAGANLPLLWVADCLKLDIPVSKNITKNCVAVSIYDLEHVFKGNISWKRYKKDRKEAQAFLFYDPEDPQPYYNMRKRMWWELPARAIFKKFRPQIVWLLKRFNK